VKELFQLKILADENIELSLIESLKKKGFNVKCITKGLKNSELLSLAEKEERIILTDDKDFLRVELYKPTFGTLVLPIYPITEMEEVLLKFLKEFPIEKIKGRAFLLTKEKTFLFERSEK
jgi:predicted nuclease of predicted toxin-antitoxin system